jgi:uncharacterized protein
MNEMTFRPTRIGCDIDFDRPGKQRGFLSVPYSSHRSAYGVIRIPIACIRGGDGPTAVLTGGNHGDEYEGQIALIKLANELTSERINGRIIIVPSLNFPAAVGSSRVSPIDDINLNRIFPGDPDGSPTQMIAHYAVSVLLARADFAMDMHSGGSSLEYLHCGLSRVSSDAAQQERVLHALEAFAAPITLLAAKPQDSRTLLAYGLDMGLPFISCEIGGGGALTAASIAVAERGLRNVLTHWGMLKGWTPSPSPRTRLMVIAGPEHYVYAPVRGLFEPAFTLGDTVKKGDTAGHIHFMDEPDRPARRLEFAGDGLVVCRRVPALVEPGDCVVHLAGDRPDLWPKT